MYEAVISNINTGHVHRKTFGSRDEANKYAQAYVHSGWRLPRNHRIEIEEFRLKPILVNIDNGLLEPVEVPLTVPAEAQKAA